MAEVSLYATTEAEPQRGPAMKYQEPMAYWSLAKSLGSTSQTFYDSGFAWLLLNQNVQQSALVRQGRLPVTDYHQSCGRKGSHNTKSDSGSPLDDLHGKTPRMDLLWNGYWRQPNKGSITLFGFLRLSLTELAGKMYGEKNIAGVRYGKHKYTSYILISLSKEPEGAEGYASDEFMALSSRFYEVLKDGQAGEADIVANVLKPDLVKRDGLAGLSLVDLFEVQVNHPVSGRLLVGPLGKQRKFMGL